MKNYYIAITLFLFFLVVYTFTLAPSVSPQGDSGELTTVAYLAGIAHPPGYPLYTILGNIFSKIPIGSIAWRINFFSAITHSLTLVVIYLIARRLKLPTLLSIATTIILGFSYTFWLYSLIAEVFPLNDLIISLIVFLTIILIHSPNNQKICRIITVIAFLFGLGMANHHSIILVALALIIVIWPKLIKFFKSIFLPSLIAFLLGLLPYLYVIWRSFTSIPAVAWSFPTNFKSLLRLFFRSDYGSLVPYQGADPSLATLVQKQEQIINYGRFLIDDFGIIVPLMALIGIILCLRDKTRVGLFLCLNFFSGVFFLTYANFPYTEFTGTTLAILERFYLLPNLFLILIFAFAVGKISQSIEKKQIINILSFSLLLYSFYLGIKNFPLVDQRNNFLGRNLGINILSNVPQNGLLFPMGDVPTFLTIYVRYTENFRPDVEIVTGNQGGPDNEYRFLKSLGKNLDFSLPKAASASGFLSANFDKIPIVTFGYPVFESPGLISSPSGMNYYFIPKDKPDNFNHWQEEVSKVVSSYLYPSKIDLEKRTTIGDRVVIGTYTNMFSNLGEFCLYNSQHKCAQDFFVKSIFFDPSVSYTYGLLADSQIKTKNCQEAKQNYEILQYLNPKWPNLNERLKTLYTDCFQDKIKAEFYKEKENQRQIELQGNLKNL